MRPHAAFSLLALLVLLALGFPLGTWAIMDFDHDGKADLVWRHTPTGQVGIWLMDGVALRQGTVVTTVADLGWRIAGIGDVDGDGKADLVWHHTGTGEVAVWLMDGVALRQGTVVTTVADLDWRIVGVGDVDGDGKADLVWHHTGTGEVAVWLMDGVALRQGTVVTTVADLSWQIVGVGDVDGDGKADLVRHHASTGEVGVWLMDGAGIRQEAVIMAVADLGWRMFGVGDVDADGKADLVWHHALTGQVGVWLMDGVALRQGTVVATVADLGWQIAGVGDVDGDGKADLAWRHTLTGQVVIWLMDGVALRQGTAVMTVADPGWQLQPERPARGTLLRPGVSKAGVIGVVGEMHVYEFWVNAPTRVVVQATGRGGAVNPCLEVYTGTPARLVSGGTACAVDKSGKFARLDLTLGAGTYVVVVHDAGDNDDGGYNVLMLPVTAATSTPLGADVPLAGQISVVGHVDLYQFAVDAPTRVVVEATRSSGGTGGISPCLEVYTGSPAQLVSGGTGCAENTSTGRVGRVDLGLAAGTYFVAVHDTGEDDKGNYRVLMLPVTPATSTSLGAGVPQTGTIEVVGDVNLHQFTLDASTRVRLQVTRSSGGTAGINPCLEIYAGVPAQPVAGGAVCAADTTTGRVGRLDLTLPGGTYFMAVRDAGGDEQGDYSVLMLPLTVAAGTSLGVGVPQVGTISGVGDIDLYQFSLETPAQVRVEVTRGPDSLSRVNACLEVYTGAPAQLVSGGAVCAGTTFAGKVAALDLSLDEGTYFVVVHDAGEDDVGEYNVLTSTP